MAEEYLTKPVKSRARRYRERLQEAGYRQVAVWLDSDAYYTLRHFMARIGDSGLFQHQGRAVQHGHDQQSRGPR